MNKKRAVAVKHMQLLAQHHPNIGVDTLSYPVIYKYNVRAKSLSMRLSRCSTHVVITLPKHFEYTHFQLFLEKCKQWIVSKLGVLSKRVLARTLFEQGASLSVLEKTLTIDCPSNHLLRGKVIIDNQLIVVTPGVRDINLAVWECLSKTLYTYVENKSREYAEILGVEFNAVHIKNLKSSYGICYSNGNIAYARRLVFAPLEVIDYVCAHEVSHLKEMNHSPAFWRLVSKIKPDYAQQKLWLKANGYLLSLYGDK